MRHSLFKTLFFALEDLRLRLHFARVIRALAGDSATAALPTETQQRRQQALQRLGQYRQENFFPRNTAHGPAQPFFYGDDGRVCAVADLLIHTGCRPLADSIVQWNNNARVREMHFPEVVQWAKHYGFTKKDLAFIQPQYYEPSAESLIVLALSCANFIWLLLWGHRSLKNVLIGLGITFVLSAVLTTML